MSVAHAPGLGIDLTTVIALVPSLPYQPPMIYLEFSPLSSGTEGTCIKSNQYDRFGQYGHTKIPYAKKMIQGSRDIYDGIVII